MTVDVGAMLLRTAAAAAVLAVAPLDSTRQPGRASLLVHVMDETGTAVRGLEREDFQIVLDGRRHGVESLSFDTSPSIVLLFDVSASVDAALGPDALLIAVEAWIGSRVPGEERWRLGSFARQLHFSGDFTQNRDHLLESARQTIAVPPAERFGPSPLWDAVDIGVAVLEPVEGTRAVIVVTDGRTTGNQRGMQEVMHHALAAGVPVFAITTTADSAFPLGGNQLLLVQPQVALELMANVTGGASVPIRSAPGVFKTAPGREAARPVSPPSRAEGLGPLLDRIVTELRQSYLLDFSTPSNRPSSQRLQVNVNRPGVTVRSRKYQVF